MPAFYFLVILGAIALWFVLPFIFKPVGKFFIRLWSDVEDAMTEVDIDKETQEERN